MQRRFPIDEILLNFVQNCIARGSRILMLFIYLFGNMVKPREMPRPLALTGTTVHTETLHEMTKQKQCDYYALHLYPVGFK